MATSYYDGLTLRVEEMKKIVDICVKGDVAVKKNVMRGFLILLVMSLGSIMF